MLIGFTVSFISRDQGQKMMDPILPDAEPVVPGIAVVSIDPAEIVSPSVKASYFL